MSNIKGIKVSTGYLTSRKKEKLKVIGFNKAHSNVLKKLDQIPLSKPSKENLSKLILNNMILDLVKVLKVGRNSISIHAKVNLEHKMFENLNETDDVVIKVYSDIRKMKTQIYAYRNTTYESLNLYQVDNIIILKMFARSKTLLQMIESREKNLNQIYCEILSFLATTKMSYYLLWSEGTTIKNIIWWKDELIILRVSNEEQGYYCRNGNDNSLKNFIELIEVFTSYGMALDEAEREFAKYFKTHYLRYNDTMYRELVKHCFSNDEFRKKSKINDRLKRK